MLVWSNSDYYYPYPALSVSFAYAVANFKSAAFIGIFIEFSYQRKLLLFCGSRILWKRGADSRYSKILLATLIV